jgi:hypothetical protein
MGRSCIDPNQRLAAQRRQDHRSEQAVLFASPHGDLVSAQHPPVGWFTAVKEDAERYLTGHARKGAHAGYGNQWIETLKAAIEIIPGSFYTKPWAERFISQPESFEVIVRRLAVRRQGWPFAGGARRG